MKKQNKTIYFIVAMVALFLLYFNLSGSVENGIYAEVLPSGEHCTDQGKDLSYTTMVLSTGIVPVEYCPISEFCDIYEVSTILDGEGYDEELLSEFQNDNSNHDCFVEESLNTQRDYTGENLDGELIKSKFACCNMQTTGGACEENICSGTFTGITDDYGCKIYGIEVCRAETDCGLVGGEKVCDPQPFINGCTWETKNEYGATFFTDFDKCGLEIVEPCGTITKYRCSLDASDLCNMEYTLETGDYVEGCGGFKTI